MNPVRALPVTLTLSLVLAACGQPATPPSAISPDHGEAFERREIGGITVASADCTIVTNQSAYCYNSAPGTQYRYVVKCNDDGIANRYSWDYGAWRNQSGTYRSYAACPAGDYFHSHYIDFR